MESPDLNEHNTAGDWSPAVEELRLRRAEAQRLGGEESVARHHERGRLTIRERIAGLVDAGSFQEVGSLTGQGRYEGVRLTGVTPAPYICRFVDAAQGKLRTTLGPKAKYGVRP